MIAVPLLVVWVSTQVLFFNLPLFTAFVLSLVLSFACSIALSKVWEHRSKRAEISFSELMIWSWYRLHRAERQLEKGLRDKESAASHDEQVEVLQGLTAALESKDPYTRGHSRRVERHSFKTGVVMGLPLDEVECLRMSASLHDVGKIRIPNDVLHKAGALTAEERTLIEEHPALGAEMVASMHNPGVVDAVRHHHERWDGCGYPDGIAGTDIPLWARVIAVADSYDAIRSNRAYRRGASRDEAVLVLNDECGHQFDPVVVEAFLKTLPARSPAVAAIASLMTGPTTMWRYLGQLFQRFGSTALAPALGAAGTAVIIGSTSLFGGDLPNPTSPLGTAAGAVSPGAPSSAFPADPLGTEQADGLTAEERAEQREEARRKERQAGDKGGADGAGGDGGSNDSAGSGGSGGSTSPGSSDGDDPTPTQEEPAAPDSTGTNTRDGSGTSGNDPTGVEGDPNEDQGKDCKEGNRERSKGSRLHCN